MKRLNLKTVFVVACAYAAAFTLGVLAGEARAQEDFEKCYGISKKGENDGWGVEINPGKYIAAADYDGMAWKFVRTGTCVGRGGRLEPFEGKGNPDVRG